MSFSPSSPVTGIDLTGFTTPTYTLIADSSAGPGVKQYLVTARGGTQGGGNGEVHSLNAPFTVTFRRPSVLRSMSNQLATAVGLAKGPLNEFTLLIRKSDKVNAVGGRVVNMVKVTFSVAPETGSQSTGLDDLRGALSLLGGLLGNATTVNGIQASLLDGSV